MATNAKVGPTPDSFCIHCDAQTKVTSKAKFAQSHLPLSKLPNLTRTLKMKECVLLCRRQNRICLGILGAVSLVFFLATIILIVILANVSGSRWMARLV